MDTQIDPVKTILFIDQDTVQLNFLVPFLEQKNFKVLIRGDFLAGISLGIEAKPDIIFVNYLLPDLRGTAVSRIFKYTPQTKNIPIILLYTPAETGDFNIQEKFKLFGAAGVFLKPISATKLLAKIKNYL